MAEASLFGARPQRLLAAVDTRKFARDLAGEGGNRLECQMPSLRGEPNRLAQDLTPIAADIDVAVRAREPRGQRRRDPDRIVFLAARPGVESREELGAPKLPRQPPHDPTSERHSHGRPQCAGVGPGARAPEAEVVAIGRSRSVSAVNGACTTAVNGSLCDGLGVSGLSATTSERNSRLPPIG
jgi:hypothetical protein